MSIDLDDLKLISALKILLLTFLLALYIMSVPSERNSYWGAAHCIAFNIVHCNKGNILQFAIICGGEGGGAPALPAL